MKSPRRCLAPTQRGGLCQNYLETCPITDHRTRRVAKPSSTGDARLDWQHELNADSAAQSMPLADDFGHFQRVVNEAADRFDLTPQLIISDYWLVRTLYAWVSTVGVRTLQRAYPDPARSAGAQHVGRVAFGGGTSLSAAWGITQRWSQDIDLILGPSDQAKPRVLQQTCKSAFSEVSRSLGGTYKITSQGPGHCFASILSGMRGEVSSIDVAFEPLDVDPLWTQSMPIMSMVGRISSAEMLDVHPELGGFSFDIIGPGTTAMNKLLAQTRTSESGDLTQISERARDVYDLACIANQAARFEGHIGRDSRALLHIAETWKDNRDPKRPPDGFASLRSFDSGSREYEALAEGYEIVMRDMVWGEPIPLDEAIQLAVSLDPGPAQPPSARQANSRIAYPHR